MYCGLLVRVQGIARFADALAFRSGTLTPSPFPLLRSVEFHALHALGFVRSPRLASGSPIYYPAVYGR